MITTIYEIGLEHTLQLVVLGRMPISWSKVIVEMTLVIFITRMERFTLNLFVALSTLNLFELREGNGLLNNLDSLLFLK